MDPKRALTKGVFCPLPWKGIMYNHDGQIKNCIRSAGSIGDLKQHSIEDIIASDANIATQQAMLNDQPGKNCYTCYDLEAGKKRFDIISDRIFYMRELKHEPMSEYTLNNHDLKVIDVRWTNLCNFACVYCSEEYSSRWAKELDIQTPRPQEQQIEQFKTYVFDHIDQLQHVYLAGGEPLLMKQNLELLELLQKYNPDVNLRINTNLSKTDTKVFEKVCEFKNVHWTVSTETTNKQFEYIRFGGKWQDFLDNLDIITKLDHKISFNMLYFLLNYNTMFDTIDYFLDRGYHPNSFIAGALLTPLYLNVRHLPENVLDSIRNRLEARIAEKPGYLLEDSYRNLLHYIDQPFEKDLKSCFEQIQIMDQRRGINSKQIFKDLYELAT